MPNPKRCHPRPNIFAFNFHEKIMQFETIWNFVSFDAYAHMAKRIHSSLRSHYDHIYTSKLTSSFSCPFRHSQRTWRPPHPQSQRLQLPPPLQWVPLFLRRTPLSPPGHRKYLRWRKTVLLVSSRKTVVQRKISLVLMNNHERRGRREGQRRKGRREGR